MRYHRAIAFTARFRGGAPKPDWLEGTEHTSVFPFDTDDDKVAFVGQLANDADNYSILYGSPSARSAMRPRAPTRDGEMDVDAHRAA